MPLMVRFGGENLPPGRKTWYDKINADGTYGGQVFVTNGDIVAAAEIGKIVGQGFRLVPNVNYYYAAGMASAVIPTNGEDDSEGGARTPEG